MRKTKWSLVLILVIGLFGFKYIFPETTAQIIDIFTDGETARAVFRSIGESINVFSRHEPDMVPVAVPEQETEPVTETATLIDCAVNLGERQSQSDPEPELPEAVSAFLKSQKEYEDLELPDTVSYEYTPFPSDYAVPVAGYNSSGFGYRMHPILGEVKFHYGTDFAAWSGENIVAFADGTVSFSGYSDTYGNYIKIDHEDGWQSLYAHCSILYVDEGDTVSSGQLIALVGDTGRVTGPHLHFELKHDGSYVNPEYYVN